MNIISQNEIIIGIVILLIMVIIAYVSHKTFITITNLSIILIALITFKYSLIYDFKRDRAALNQQN